MGGDQGRSPFQHDGNRLPFLSSLRHKALITGSLSQHALTTASGKAMLNKRESLKRKKRLRPTGGHSFAADRWAHESKDRAVFITSVFLQPRTQPGT